MRKTTAFGMSGLGTWIKPLLHLYSIPGYIDNGQSWLEVWNSVINDMTRLDWILLAVGMICLLYAFRVHTWPRRLRDRFVLQPKEFPAAVPASRVPTNIDVQQSQVSYYGPRGLMVSVFVIVENGLDVEVRMRRLSLDIEMDGGRLGCRFLAFQHRLSAKLVKSVGDIAVPARLALGGWAHFDHQDRIRTRDFRRFLFTAQAIGEPEQLHAFEPYDWDDAKNGHSELVILPSGTNV